LNRPVTKGGGSWRGMGGKHRRTEMTKTATMARTIHRQRRTRLLARRGVRRRRGTSSTSGKCTGGFENSLRQTVPNATHCNILEHTATNCNTL